VERFSPSEKYQKVSGCAETSGEWLFYAIFFLAYRKQQDRSIL
jgi:hypothetical protein